MIKTEMGLPFVLRFIYVELIQDMKRINNKRDKENFFDELFERMDDPIYKSFIKNSFELYSDRNSKIYAQRHLILGYELLKRDGELPKLDRKKFNKRWKGNMNRETYNIIKNITLNTEKVHEDSPVYFKFIKDSANNFPICSNSKSFIEFIIPNNKLFIFSDHLCSYMFLADNVS